MEIRNHYQHCLVLLCSLSVNDNARFYVVTPQHAFAYAECVSMACSMRLVNSALVAVRSIRNAARKQNASGEVSNTIKTRNRCATIDFVASTSKIDRNLVFHACHNLPFYAQYTSRLNSLAKRADRTWHSYNWLNAICIHKQIHRNFEEFPFV